MTKANMTTALTELLSARKRQLACLKNIAESDRTAIRMNIFADCFEHCCVARLRLDDALGLNSCLAKAEQKRHLEEARRRTAMAMNDINHLFEDVQKAAGGAIQVLDLSEMRSSCRIALNELDEILGSPMKDKEDKKEERQ